MSVNVYLGDCMELMKGKPDKFYDLAIVDPPYGIGENGQRNITGDRPTAKWKNPKSQHYVTFDDSEIPTAEYWQELFRVSKNQIVWGGNYFTEYLPPSKGWIVWDKQADIKEHLSMCELAWSSFDRKCNKFEYLWAGFKKKHQVERIHPTQKPVALYQWILDKYATCKYCKGEGNYYEDVAGDGGSKMNMVCEECEGTGKITILDTHGGSMSSVIACLEYGFSIDCIEKDPDYYDAARKRITSHVSQANAFVQYPAINFESL